MGSWIGNVDFEAQLYSDPIYIYVTHSRMFKPTHRFPASPGFGSVQMEQESHCHLLAVRGTSRGNWSTSIPTRGMGRKISSLTSLVTMGIQSTLGTRVLCRQFSISSTKCP